MVRNVNNLIGNCSACAQKRGDCELREHLKLFLASRPLEFIAIDILGPLPRAVKVKQYVVIKTDRYKNITRVVNTGKTAKSQLDSIFFGLWIIFHGIYVYILSDKCVQFTSKLFATLSAILGVKPLTTKAYHPKVYG